MNSYETHTAIVTGASRGLGAVVAAVLAGAGYDLVLTARGDDALDATAASLPGEGLVETVVGDVTDRHHRRAVAETASELGHVTLLVNNASALGPSPLPELADYPLDELRRVFETNVFAPLALVQATRPILSPGALVVNVTSDAAVSSYPTWGGYGASKAALGHVTRTLAAEENDLHAVAVDPGDMRTRMHQRAFPGEDISDRPDPAVTRPFWVWLLGRDPAAVNGRRFEAQGDAWLTVDSEAP